ncbi:MAG: hypothetical protein CW342_10355 [Thermoactinomycetaceae bacterium]|nr:hypothetical protein [Thermoactinomycetaceae bacterium]
MPPTPSRAAKGVPADAIGVDVGIQHGDDLQPLIFDPAEVFIEIWRRGSTMTASPREATT